ncbi:MAG: hypothetical protein AAF497_23025 [Planctomycetota bacterium]
MTELLARTRRLAQHVDDVLRREDWVTASVDRRSIARLVVLVFLFAGIYGAAMGSYECRSAERLVHVAFVATKAPLLLLATFAISLPSFYVINSLFGLQRDFPIVLRAILATQAGVAIILASLAPVTLFWYASTTDYGSAVLFNAFVFGAASLLGQRLMRSFYRRLIERDARHATMLWIWIAVYALVGVQMGWIMRPFIGSVDEPVQFFRSGEWTNAYVVIMRLFGRAAGIRSHYLIRS